MPTGWYEVAALPYLEAAALRRDLIHAAARTARGHLTTHLPRGWHRKIITTLTSAAKTNVKSYAVDRG